MVPRSCRVHEAASQPSRRCQSALLGLRPQPGASQPVPRLVPQVTGQCSAAPGVLRTSRRLPAQRPQRGPRHSRAARRPRPAAAPPTDAAACRPMVATRPSRAPAEGGCPRSRLAWSLRELPPGRSAPHWARAAAATPARPGACWGQTAWWKARAPRPMLPPGAPRGQARPLATRALWPRRPQSQLLGHWATAAVSVAAVAVPHPSSGPCPWQGWPAHGWAGAPRPGLAVPSAAAAEAAASPRASAVAAAAALVLAPSSARPGAAVLALWRGGRLVQRARRVRPLGAPRQRGCPGALWCPGVAAHFANHGAR
mmetsp:Transcript_112746/g.349957  ORF Transcript_112746/g.349957 Transcript_112746/m.349957 type:complete len:312 (-) Transcript_112746:593-1528(-)